MPAEFAALPPNVPDSDALAIAHFQEVASRLAAQGEDLRAQYYAEWAYALAAGQPVVNGVAIGSADARVTTTRERLPDGVVVSNLRAQALNTRPREEILKQPPAFARVERSPIHQSQAADTFARRSASDQRPVIAREPVERIGPVKVPPIVSRALMALGFVGRVTSKYHSYDDYNRSRQNVVAITAEAVAKATQQHIQPRLSEIIAAESGFETNVEATVVRAVDDAEANRQSLMLEFMENPARFVPDWIKDSPFNV